MCLCRRHMACARIRVSLGRHSMLWNSWMGAFSRMHHFRVLVRRSGTRCKRSSYNSESEELYQPIFIHRWRAAVLTLASLHSITPASVNLSAFGRPSGFYNRQVKTLSAISLSQSQAVDVETKAPVGKIPHFDAMVTFFSDPSTQPVDRGTLIHGDYKIDNLVYHKTEPRVIGILDWEMSTIGHPLSDLSNLLTPYTFAASPPSSSSPLSSRTNPAFYPPKAPLGLPSREECIRWYSQAAGWDPSVEMAWGDAFGVFRNSVIMQGIAARFALRQASSARAKEYAVQMGPFGEFAWGLVVGCMGKNKEKSKL
jgi:aminoglycoside phosphotransferase (APT) family kinase protein